jgi:two-component system response regulator
MNELNLGAQKRGRVFRLFLLEDDDNDALLIVRALKRSGQRCELRRFHNPHEAIAALETVQNPERNVPHLILTDLKMPKMTGMEFVTWLRNSPFSCVPVIMLSGSSLPEDVLQAYRIGTNSFSTKPVDPHDLDQIVATVMKYWNEACHTPASIMAG